MEFSWFTFLPLSICVATTIFLILLSQTKAKKKTKLSIPPGPLAVPILGNIFLLPRILFDIDSVICDLCNKYGPIITLRLGSSVSIFISSHSLTHEALIQNGAALNHRPGPVTPSCILDNSYPDVGSSSGTRWRFLRRNLTSVILTPSRYKSFGRVREWAMQILNDKLKYHVESRESVPVLDQFRYAMFCLLLFMCFGEKLDEKVIREIEEMEKAVLTNYRRFLVFTFFPTLGKIIFKKRWLQMLEMRRRQQSALLPLIKASRERNEKIKQENPVDDAYAVSYIKSLFDLEIKEEGGRKLNDQEIVTLISEVLDAGSDTTSTVLQWIMAQLVKDQSIQEKLYSDIEAVVSSGEEIREEDLQKMPYLKAVVMEGLRLHPPTHFVLPHYTKEDIVLNDYVIPKNAVVNFMVPEMGQDPKVWKDPMEFKPERFMGDEGEVVDITGTKGIKMMPFSVGRRICPGYGLGILHLEYFLANLVRKYKWTTVEGHDLDMSEKKEFTTIMATPLHAHVSPRPK